MVICCAAANCSNRQGKGEKRAVSFHRFPLKDSKRLIQWLKAVQRDNWTPTKYSFLCSEHFTKDSFSKRLEDQHRLLKPTAVPSIFHLPEKKRGPGGHGRTRRRVTRKASGGLRGHASGADGKGAAGSSSSLGESPMAKPGSRKGKQATLQGETTPKASQEAIGQERTRQALEGTPGDGPAPAAGGQGEADASAMDAGGDSAAAAAPPDGGLVDKSGISKDDFTPPGSGACKFIGSLHSYSFSSKHARERASVPREPVDRKRPKRDVEPSCSGTGPGPDKGLAQSPPSSSLTATPQKPSQSPSAPPTDVTPKPAAEAVQSEHSDASPMSINEVILSASGACKLIDSLHSYCFSSRQNKSQVCCLREQVEKKNGELKTLRQRVSRSDSQVRKLQEKLDELRRVSFPYLSSLLPFSREPPTMNPVVEPLSWMLGTWLSDPPGAGTFPTLQPFQYLEEVCISHVGQPVLNFSFNAFHPDTRKPMHRECGFIRLKPDTNKVAFVSAQNTGIVEVEEGEVNGQELCITSHSIARISFAKEPHVEQITRKFRLNSEGKLEQTVSMATTTQPMTQHLHITYKRVTP
ncbi:peroxynitrite isomerase THAP4 isoform 2-T2 [Lycaon pictus]|uniref:Peroxynitrite isomerase THAP4 n=2 Tax=Canis lupus dingo TaxID=286419 RepID=A0A8C0LLB7_CANLU|nr:peroxynitrite isomerase THAP4 isoform X1 [Canis lupus dingo]XP_038291964.1 peroxynitrite isomerase THAP4 isoform X1 [Canis lupus familiaris]XP_038314094.1 peroxynitrite isomerase THAP4 isoform X1 [Canis lupus familiaris]XP_038430385.1 peroxynitrite isomerase THAP4 isoform X1 [Canis lupus familiaris]